MDGYAVTGEDRQRMAEQGVPYRLRVACTIDAGDTAEYRIRRGEAARIMTGARIPQGAALVVPQEETVPEEDGDQYVRILELPERDNIAPIGEDFYKGEVLGITLPEKIEYEITHTEPAVKGNTATNATKEATLENGLTIKVPLFINENDKVIVSTKDGKYDSRA
ncbi:MAG: hypothetical protein IJM69_00020, partial [Firmicutes bacterium]|nr:hypothetical protein [Bacillota bacterium]